MISYTMETASLRPVNTVATYTCTTGYILTGGSTRTCGSDGMWSGSALTCQSEWNGLCILVLFVFVEYSYVNTKYPWLQFPVALLPLLPTDIPDNQPAQ